MGNFQNVRGTRDLLAEDAEKQKFIIDQARKTSELYGYEEAITPIVESYELLNAKSGEEIRQRMFVLEDLGHRKIVLRPEFTASIARLATTTLKNKPRPWRIFSVGTVYRYDEPQRGRYREFWQSNFELMGSSKPEADAEIVLLTNRLMRAVGLHRYEFKLGHVGILRAILSHGGTDEQTQNAILQYMDKKEYDKALGLMTNDHCVQVFQELINLKMCDSCVANPAVIVKKLKGILKSYEKALSELKHLSEILDLVKQSRCKIKTVDPAFARGLEYYTGMIFEVYIPELDIALGGGGRYDRLIEAFGGQLTPAVGVAHGLDRIALAMEMQETVLKTREKNGVVVIPVNEKVRGRALQISEMLRRAKIPTEFEVMGRRIGAALEDANRRNLKYAVIVGERELSQDKVVMHDIVAWGETTIEIKKLRKEIKKTKTIKKNLIQGPEKSASLVGL